MHAHDAKSARQPARGGEAPRSGGGADAHQRRGGGAARRASDRSGASGSTVATGLRRSRGAVPDRPSRSRSGMGSSQRRWASVILPDVNVLVYAFRREAADHNRYASWLVETLTTGELGLAESALLGLVRIVTSPKIMADPAPTPVALQFVETLLDAPRARLVTPTAATWSRFRAIASNDVQVRGPLVPDAWLAALALSHGCRLATADRGFACFPGLNWFVPVEPSPG